MSLASCLKPTAKVDEFLKLYASSPYNDFVIISYPVDNPVAEPPKTYPAASVVSS